MRSSLNARKRSKFKSGPYLDTLLTRAARMDAALQREICARIKQARIEAGMTLEEMAAQLDVTLRAYWNYENNRVPFRRLDDIARITGRPQHWLLRGEAENSEPHQSEAHSALLRGVAAAVETLERSQESVHQKLDETIALLTELEARSSAQSAPRAARRKGSRPA